MISEEIENANLSKIEEYQYKRMIGLNENINEIKKSAIESLSKTCRCSTNLSQVG